MSKAELHGKLSPETAHDRMEDLLTSDVFGTMYYAGFDAGFADWIFSAEAAVPCAPPMRQFLGLASTGDTSFAFWPKLPNGREPDVAILFTSAEGSKRLLLVEVKYLSGPSDFAPGEEARARDDERGLTGNQLADQMIGFQKAAHGQIIQRWFGIHLQTEPLSFAHLLVTTHRALPADIYQEAKSCCLAADSTMFPCPAYWLPWQSLAAFIEPHLLRTSVAESRLLGDLVRLLERKELISRPFRAFHNLEWPSQEVGGFWKSDRLLFSKLAGLNFAESSWDGGNASFWKGQQ